MGSTATDKILGHLLERLGGKALSFPHPVEKLEAVQTHISVVLLAGEFAYKIKKPVKLPFVDYSTLEKRKKFCLLEVDLNRRLTEGVYLDVVPLTLQGGQLKVEGLGEAVEYAVKMRRLPDTQRLGSLLEKGLVPEKFWTHLSYRLTRFYREASRGPEVSKWASAQAVEENWEEVLSQVRDLPPDILELAVRERLENLCVEWIHTQMGRIDRRVKAARDGHGDLRLEHIYYPQEAEPGDLKIIDCVEFNPRYRCADPLCDVAFLLMDLDAAGFRNESRIFKQEFLRASGEGSDHLVEFYTAYRHLVRGMVRGLQSREEDATPESRTRAGKKARAHFLGALGQLAEPAQKPCLILLGGLPGVGKSTLAQQLAPLEKFATLASDVTRKELAGQSLGSQPAIGYEKGIYKPEWTEKTYSTLLERAEAALRRGERVLVDASFMQQLRRERFQEMARELGIPFLFFVCLIGHDQARQRLAETRQFGSDADLEIYRKMAEHWERLSPDLGTLFLNTERPIEVNLTEIQRVLREKGLSEIPDQVESRGRGSS